MNRFFVSALIGCGLLAFAGLPMQAIAASKADKYEKEVKEAKETISSTNGTQGRRQVQSNPSVQCGCEAFNRSQVV